MWKKFIKDISSDYIFKNPANISDLEQLESIFKIKLPTELKTFLNETDGVYGEYGCPLIWSSNQIQQENINIRSHKELNDFCMTFESLFFFSDAGNGDLFAYAVTKNGTIEKGDIYVWNHENDSRTWVAPSLQKFIEWWNQGKITI
ncbi:SMI1/KNR4 family protein [Bacillus sp. AFS018417]|uniref:SMI1/KNR4 family protein n=1 Tax=Bacillus sp. AFS018417 TaxID=2033491 RepID=UPI000BF7065D|nr:SMI1/KNR4 family protein [Bacillus sp. AFS018417]PEY99681.1 SMI1/KNR4 family protein [Bacillus sp. AFS018417]